MADESKFSGYFQAVLWSCTSCGNVIEKGQPMMECDLCEAYKTAFVNIPQDIEATVRAEFPDLPPKHIKCRERRLELMQERKVVEIATNVGRVLPTQSGNHIDPTEFDL